MRTSSVYPRAEMLGKANVGLHSSPRYSKRKSKPSKGRSPCQRSRLQQPARQHGEPTLRLRPRPSLADRRIRIKAASGQNDAICATVSAARTQGKDHVRRVPATAAGRVVVTAVHADINKHYQTAQRGIHRPPRAAGQFVPCADGNTVPAGLGPRTMPSARHPRCRPSGMPRPRRDRRGRCGDGHGGRGRSSEAAAAAAAHAMEDGATAPTRVGVTATRGRGRHAAPLREADTPLPSVRQTRHPLP
jgi:hypothetical protein